MATEDELRIAHEIMKTVRRLQLPLRLDEITEGRGNCFPLSVLAQCRRQEIKQYLNEPTRILVEQNDPTLLRRAVHAFMANSKHEKIQEYKKMYTEVLAVLDNKTWRKYWEVMLRNYEWVDYIFIQSTAWFLNHDIIIITTTSTDDHPYITISGNLIDEKIPCHGIPLTIGTKSNVHYQSLLPFEVIVSRNPIEPSSPENTIDLELSAAMSSAEKEYPDMDSREEFPDLSPSNGKSYAQPRASTSGQNMNQSTKSNDFKLAKEQQYFKQDKKNENPEGPEQPNKKKAFKYMQDGKILNFQFVSEKRVKCPKCQKDYKNILLHIQRSSCRVSDTADLSEKFQQYTKVHLEQELKDDQRK